MAAVQIRSAVAADAGAMLAVARALPGWINAGGIEQMTRDFQVHRGAVAVEGSGRGVGFITWTLAEPGSVELTWLGVVPELHRAGVGRRLVAAIAETCRAEGIYAIHVSTLADTVAYEPYARTRSFYRALGFADYRVDPGSYDGDDRLLLRFVL
jgi:GNAT superfamily N-acetyltransferase